MEPIRFADILFIIIVLAITFGILFMVNKSRKKASSDTGDDSGKETESPEDDNERTG